VKKSNLRLLLCLKKQEFVIFAHNFTLTAAFWDKQRLWARYPYFGST